MSATNHAKESREAFLKSYEPLGEYRTVFAEPKIILTRVATSHTCINIFKDEFVLDFFELHWRRGGLLVRIHPSLDDPLGIPPFCEYASEKVSRIRVLRPQSILGEVGCWDGRVQYTEVERRLKVMYEDQQNVLQREGCHQREPWMQFARVSREILCRDRMVTLVILEEGDEEWEVVWRF